MSENQGEFPTVTESEVDEPSKDTKDPYVDLELKDGVGFQDEEATEMDTEPPDLDNEDEPTVDEPEEDS